MSDPLDPTRREFLQAGASGIAAAGISGSIGEAADRKNQGGVPLRPLGKTGEMVSLIGLGGWSASDPNKLDEAATLRLIQRAVREGITFLDNAWDYHDGMAEERMGKALAQSGLRDQVFLMTKCCGRTAADAQSGLEDSLRRLKTDHLDLWQYHEINYDNDPDWIFEDDGAIAVGLKALKEGKIRHLGFTSHKDPSIHLKMLDKPFDWAATMMPLNVLDANYRSFQKQVLPVLNRRGIGCIGMKSLGGSGAIVTKAGVPIDQALNYVFSLPIATLVSGIDSEQVLDQNLKIVREHKPMTAEERKAIEAKYLRVAGDGRYELFKSATSFDGPHHRKQHGFEVAATA